MTTVAVEPQSATPLARSDGTRCRFCGSPLNRTFVDLGTSPPCQRHMTPENFNTAEATYPLHAYVCDKCFLVQVSHDVQPEELFSDYAYFSSFSDSWLKHASDYVEMITARLGLTTASQVMEIASNDGYLLQFFAKKHIPVMGIEPAANVAEHAIAKGIPTITRFFGVGTARDLVRDCGQPNLLLGNNVLAHVPDLNDFVAGMKLLLKAGGVITMEFPHLLKLMAENQFDTIYHEHFSYFSFYTVEQVFAKHGLTMFDVEELPTHGGSLRIFARHTEDSSKPVGRRVANVREAEITAGVTDPAFYASFTEQVKETKRKLLEFLIAAKRAGKTVVGYGAPGKGNTLLNYCGIRTDFVDYTVDRNPKKQGNFLPGSRIPIHGPDRIDQTTPDYLLILPWNLKDEIMQQMAHIRAWGGKFVVPIPTVMVLD